MIQRKCIRCNEEIHPMRLEVLPNTQTCVQCSKEGKKAGRLVAIGVGEEIETTLEILDQEVYKKITYQDRDLTEDDLQFIPSDTDEEVIDNNYSNYQTPLPEQED